MITLHYTPTMDIISPEENVTYTGSNVNVKVRVNVYKNIEGFQALFQDSFFCFNIDAGVAYACHVIYTNTSISYYPILGLEPGLHTIKASLIHPNGDLFLQSMSKTIVFYTVGLHSEYSLFNISVTLDGNPYYIPISEDVDDYQLVAQAKSFCNGVGLERDNSCLKKIYDRLNQEWESVKLK